MYVYINIKTLCLCEMICAKSLQGAAQPTSEVRYNLGRSAKVTAFSPLLSLSLSCMNFCTSAVATQVARCKLRPDRAVRPPRSHDTSAWRSRTHASAGWLHSKANKICSSFSSIHDFLVLSYSVTMPSHSLYSYHNLYLVGGIPTPRQNMSSS